MLDRRVSLQWPRQFEMLRRVVLAEIRRLEQLLYQYDVRAAFRGFADQFLGARHIGVAIPTACHLGGRYRYGAHINRPPRAIAQNVGGELALTSSHSSRPGFRNRCGMELLK